MFHAVKSIIFKIIFLFKLNQQYARIHQHSISKVGLIQLDILN